MRSRSCFVALGALALLLLGSSAFAAGASSVSAPVDRRIFAGRAAGERASFLVVLRAEADLSGAASIDVREERIRFVHDALRAQAEVSQAAIVARLDREGVRFRSFFLVNMLEVEGTRELAEELSRLSEVSSIAPNPRVRLAPEPTGAEHEPRALPPIDLQAATAVEPNLLKIGANRVWARGFTGQGMVVAIADTGVEWTHPALVAHYRGAGGVAVHDYNWHDAIHDAGLGNSCGSDVPMPCDDDGHGTGTAGVSVGDDGAGAQIGVAPGASWIACRNMDRGMGTPARYTECFEWFLAPTDRNGANPRPDLAPHVVNNSWGCPPSEGCTDPNVLKAVVDHVAAAGIFVAFSAGNSGPSCGTVSDVPVFYASVFSVGATTLSDDIASFSSRGPATADGSGRLKPDLSAPGVNVRTAALPSGYRPFSGTSAASPHVAGAVALLWSAAPALAGDIPGTAALLERTAVPITSAQDCSGFPGATIPNAVFGWGRLAIDAAVDAALAPPPAERETPLPPPSRRRPPRVVVRPGPA